VKFSVKSDYAARAVLGLARHYAGGKAVRVEDLAAEQGIPANYLVQILIELKSGGIVRSMRGKEGGYLLGRPPSEITMGDVLRTADGTLFDSPALASPSCPEELRAVWRKLQMSIEQTANGIDFQQLSEEAAQKKMWYI
jgi:Rrf2 family protein